MALSANDLKTFCFYAKYYESNNCDPKNGVSNIKLSECLVLERKKLIVISAMLYPNEYSLLFTEQGEELAKSMGIDVSYASENDYDSGFRYNG